MGRWLVKQDDLRLDRQNASQRGATALTGTEVMRRAIALAVQPYLSEAALDPLAHHGRIQPQVERSESHVPPRSWA